MRRGDLVTIAMSGDFGKPRPALVLQSDAHSSLPSLTVLPLTSELHNLSLMRVAVGPGRGTGLEFQSHIMVDKATTVLRTKTGPRIGQINRDEMATVSRAVARFLGLD